MSLAVRLLIAFSAVAILVTALVGLFARDFARKEVEHGFELRMAAAMNGARGELVFEAENLGEVLAPLCSQKTFLDDLLIALRAADGKVEDLPDRIGIALRSNLPKERRALRVDSLIVIDGKGLVIAAADRDARRAEQLQATRDRGLAKLLRSPAERPRLVWDNGVAKMQAHCALTAGGVTVGLVGSKMVAPILDRVGHAYDVALALSRDELPNAGPGSLRRKLQIADIEGMVVHASISRQPLFETLAQLDSTIFLTGAIAVLLSIALAVFLARSLSLPLVELANETREVVRGSPKPVEGRGGREFRQLAKSFNQTIEELTRMRKRLARTERIAARREVARQVAHEIKNPLAPIRAAMETLRRLRDRDSPQFDDYFDEATKTVLEEVHRIKSIVGEFTKFARMPPPNFERLDLEDVARGVLSIHDAKDDPEGPRVALEAEDIPAVLADQNQMVQVLTNLVQNGIEASRDAGRRPSVRVLLGPRGEREIAMVVEDNGPGVDETMRDRLFEPYVSTKAEGTGLGLAIVQTILHEHGGEVTYDDVLSEDGERCGARFTVVLPIDGPPLLEKAPTSDTAD
jgi:signal transduction histidine kinase